MKKRLWWLGVGLALLLTACGAPQAAEEGLTYEQQLSAAMALCREDLPKGRAALAELGAQLLDGRQLEGQDCTLGLWQLQCGEQTVLLWQLDCAAAEEHPGTLDTLHLTWEGAAYHHAEGDAVWSSLQGRVENTASFNIEDSHLAAGDSTCGAVYLKDPATAYSARLEHTADARETTLTADGETVTAITREVQQVWTLLLEHKEETS